MGNGCGNGCGLLPEAAARSGARPGAGPGLAALLLSLALGVIPGCTAWEWTKPGATPEMFAHDDAACRNDSLARAPVQIVTVYPPYMPGRFVCRTDEGFSFCHAEPGFSMFPHVFDANARVREQLYASCLRAGGWDLTEVKDR